MNLGGRALRQGAMVVLGVSLVLPAGGDAATQLAAPRAAGEKTEAAGTQHLARINVAERWQIEDSRLSLPAQSPSLCRASAGRMLGTAT